MLLAIDSLDRLVEFVEEHDGRVRAGDAARFAFALSRVPDGVARALLGPLVGDDARLCWRGPFVALASAADPALLEASFVVFDLETTGLATASARICEIGAVEIRRLELGASFETLVAPEVTLSRATRRLTGISEELLASAPDAEQALARFSSFAGDAVLVAHNARFDIAFLNRELERRSGRRLSGPVVDTVALARNLLAGRSERTSLATLAHFFGVSVRPCHRALPDAQATAEVFLRLVELARERGAERLSQLEELAAPRPRRIHAKRHLIRAAPAAPGTYRFCADDELTLYVGKARDLRSRLRSYFHTPHQRRTVEAALDKLVRIEWQVTGSELQAALEEVRLIRQLRPPANTRMPRPERYVYLHRQSGRVILSRAPSRLGPIRQPLEARRAARALKGCAAAEFEGLLDGDPLPRLRAELARLSLDAHELELRRARRELEALERLVVQLNHLDQLRNLTACVVAPALEPGELDVHFVCGGELLVERMSCAAASPARLIARLTALAARRAPPPALAADRLDELLVVSSFIARTPPELRVLPAGLQLARPSPPAGVEQAY